MTDNIPQPGDRQPDDDDLFAAHKRRKRKRLLMGLAVCAFLVGLGYGAYYAFFRVDHLISQVQDCSISKHTGIEERCKKPMQALVRELPKECPRVLAAMKNVSNLYGKNNLLYALLKARIARHDTDGELTLAAVRANRCIQAAVLHVHQSAKGPKDDFPGSFIAGVSGYNIKLLKQPANWGIRMRILGKVHPRNQFRAFADLAPLAVWISHQTAPGVRKATRRVLKDHVLPTMLRIFRRALRTAGQKPRWKQLSPLPNGFEEMVARLAPLKGPLFTELLDTFFRRIRYGDKKMYALNSWFESLFRYWLLDARDQLTEKHRVVIERLAKHRHECHGCFEYLLGKLAAKGSPPLAKLQRWLRQDLKRAMLKDHGGQLPRAILDTLERFPDGPLLSRLVHVRKLDFGYRPNLVLRALSKIDKDEGREVVRSFHVALLARRLKG